jgi:enoyl-CoA hydratase/carnithine racemase
VTVRSERAGAAMVLTIDRPATRNALDAATAGALATAVRAADGDPEVRAVVLAATGDRVFVSGGDLNEIAALLKSGRGPDALLAVGEELAALERCEVPVIAAVQGATLGGGCELLLFCDQVICERQATLCFPHARMGLVPAWGSGTRLLELVGARAAARLLYTAAPVTAEAALAIGLVDEVVERGQARAGALALAQRIAGNPRATVAAAKRALHAARGELRSGAMSAEQAVFRALWGGPDHLAALAAFSARK